ncbi:histidine kinase [Agromyces sp. NPDC049794]|uniref:sensor histidine kinase n=1 Tax=unclassified Agromyces TaxID=2639701 RepID=UPI0034098274
MAVLEELRRRAGRHADLAGSLGYTALAVIMIPAGLGVYWVDEPRLITWWADLALVLVLAAVHAFRDRWPVGVLIGAGGVMALGALLTGATSLGAILMVADLLYLFALRSPSRAVDVALYLSGVAAIVGVLLLASPGGPPEVVLRFLWIPVTCLLSLWWGRAVRAPRLEAVAEREHAEATRRAAEADRQRALASERMAIGRDLHDMLAGHVVGIAMQSEAALRSARDEGSATTPALEAIRASSLAALGEMRSLIDVLRGDAHALAAPATLADLDTLIESAREAGADARAHVEVDALDGVPPTVSVAAYRIVQEGLANAAKHAPGRPVEVHVAQRDGDLVVRVVNPTAASGTLPAPLSSVQGLIGVEERARLLGGRAEAHVDQRDGERQWVLEATLPLRRSIGASDGTAP